MKRGLLIGYMVVCVALIGAILVGGLDGDAAEGQPSFYRATAESFGEIDQAQTEAADSPEAAGTPQPGGAGGHQTEATPTNDLHLQKTLDAIPTIED